MAPKLNTTLRLCKITWLPMETQRTLAPSPKHTIQRTLVFESQQMLQQLSTHSVVALQGQAVFGLYCNYSKVQPKPYLPGI